MAFEGLILEVSCLAGDTFGHVHADPAGVVLGQDDVIPIIRRSGLGDKGAILLDIVFRTLEQAVEPSLYRTAATVVHAQQQIAVDGSLGLHVEPNRRGAAPVGDGFAAVFGHEQIHIFTGAPFLSQYIVMQIVLAGSAFSLDNQVLVHLFTAVERPDPLGLGQDLIFGQIGKIQDRPGGGGGIGDDGLGRGTNTDGEHNDKESHRQQKGT